MKAGCSPHRGASKGGLEEHHGEADLRVRDRRELGVTPGKRTRRATFCPGG